MHMRSADFSRILEAMHHLPVKHNSKVLGSDKGKEKEKMRNVHSLLSKIFQLARDLLCIPPSEDSIEMSMSEMSSSSNMYWER